MLTSFYAIPLFFITNNIASRAQSLEEPQTNEYRERINDDLDQEQDEEAI